MIKAFVFLLSIIPLQFIFSQTSLQDKKVLPFGFIEEINSKALGEQRVLNVWLPYGYDPDSTETYPVVYVLDGSAHEDFPHIAGLVQFMNMYDLMPKSIVLGIANVDRYRDFSHPTTDKKDLEALPTGGGSEKFIRFLKEEVQPFVREHYKTNGHSTIIGQSMGGLLASEILLTQPAMFNDYIIVSPSLWWDSQSLVKGADTFFKAHPKLENKVFVSLGKEHPTMHEVADMLVNAIKTSGNEKLIVYYEPILTEDHATILHRAVYRGFELLNQKED